MALSASLSSVSPRLVRASSIFSSKRFSSISFFSLREVRRDEASEPRSRGEGEERIESRKGPISVRVVSRRGRMIAKRRLRTIRFYQFQQGHFRIGMLGRLRGLGEGKGVLGGQKVRNGEHGIGFRGGCCFGGGFRRGFGSRGSWCGHLGLDECFKGCNKVCSKGALANEPLELHSKSNYALRATQKLMAKRRRLGVALADDEALYLSLTDAHGSATRTEFPKSKEPEMSIETEDYTMANTPLERAQTLSKTDPKQAEKILTDIINAPQGNFTSWLRLRCPVLSSDCVEGKDDALLREKEQALLQLGELYSRERSVPYVTFTSRRIAEGPARNATQLADVVRQSRGLPIAKARAAKLVKSLIDLFSAIPNSETVRVATYLSMSRTQMVVVHRTDANRGDQGEH